MFRYEKKIVKLKCRGDVGLPWARGGVGKTVMGVGEVLEAAGWV